MRKFIEVINGIGKRVLVNIDHIEAVVDSRGDKNPDYLAQINFTGDEEFMYVKNSYEEIMSVLCNEGGALVEVLKKNEKADYS